MTAKSANGWPTVTNADSPSLRDWVIGPVILTLRSGPAGFILAHLAQWFHEEIERLSLHDMPDGANDDHGWGQRFIGDTDVPSNHWSATAMDLNALRHPQHTAVLATYTPTQAKRIRTKLHDKYPGVIWGGDWSVANLDSMHYEFDQITDFTKAEVRTLALALVDTPIGKRLMAAQPKPVHPEKW